MPWRYWANASNPKYENFSEPSWKGLSNKPTHWSILGRSKIEYASISLFQRPQIDHAGDLKYNVFMPNVVQALDSHWNCTWPIYLCPFRSHSQSKLTPIETRMFHCPNFDALTVLGKASDTYKSIVILKACQMLYKMSTIRSRFDGDDKISHRQIPYT